MHIPIYNFFKVRKWHKMALDSILEFNFDKSYGTCLLVNGKDPNVMLHNTCSNPYRPTLLFYC